jgi:hypothetical protein
LFDVSILDCIVAGFCVLFGEIDVVFVVGKGFFSRKDVVVGVLFDWRVRFLVGVSFFSGFVVW